VGPALGYDPRPGWLRALGPAHAPPAGSQETPSRGYTESTGRSLNSFERRLPGSQTFERVMEALKRMSSPYKREVEQYFRGLSE
jgi:hypothetical protein